MHVGLFDLGSSGHHTPYSARISRHLVTAGHEVTFITSHDHDRLDAFPDDGAFSVEQLSPPPISTSLRERYLPSQLQGEKPKVTDMIQYARGIRVAEQIGVDVLHCPSIEGMELPLWFAGLQSPSFPILATAHRDHYGIGLGLDTLNCLGIRSCFTNGTLSTLFVHAESMAIRVKGSVPPANGRNVKTAPYPTPSPLTNLSRAEARDRLDLPPDLPLLLFFGLHTYEKGPDLLFEAVREFDEPVGVVFAGGSGVVTSDDLDSFQADDGGDARVINRIGWVDEEDVYPYFAAADVAMLPIRRTIGVSETLNRACLTNTHLITSDDCDVGYLVEHEEIGQTFERGSVAALREAIRQFLHNRDRYPLPRIEEFGRSQLIERTGEQFEEAYRAALERQ